MRRITPERTPTRDAEPTPDGLEGKLTTTKWAKITKTSPDTALRDITQLIERGILVRGSGGGRSTSYTLAAPAAGAAFNSGD
jgi:DeoR/GlpR family transcriptional regulator of sugar metabolism